MAFRKSSRFSIHKIITIFAVVIMVAGIGFTVFASQQTTQTESDAASNRCNRNPTIVHTSSVNKANSVTYNLRLYNNDRAGCGRKNFWINGNVPSGWNGTLININGKVVNKLVHINPQGSKRFKFKVVPSRRARVGWHNVSVGAASVSNTKAQTLKSLRYYKD